MSARVVSRHPATISVELASGLVSYLIGEPDGRCFAPPPYERPQISGSDRKTSIRSSPKDYFNITADDEQANEAVMLE